MYYDLFFYVVDSILDIEPLDIFSYDTNSLLDAQEMQVQIFDVKV
jgi:hypothetical protein